MFVLKCLPKDNQKLMFTTLCRSLATFGRSWGALDKLLAAFGCSWGALGLLLAALGPLLAALGRSWAALGTTCKSADPWTGVSGFLSSGSKHFERTRGAEKEGL